MRLRVRRWLGMATPIALLGGLLWLLAEGDIGLPALLRSAAWGLVVWVGSSVIWLGLEYGQGHEDAREQWNQINRLDPGESAEDRSRGRTESEAAGRRPLGAAGGPGSRRAHAGHASLG